MINSLARWKNQLLGRGDAAITIPVLDGALKANNALEAAAVFATLEAPEDMATDGRSLYVADGPSVRRFDLEAAGSGVVDLLRFDRPVTALAALPDGGLAVVIDGSEVRIAGGPRHGVRWDTVAGKPLRAANSIAATSDGRLLVTDGSIEHSTSEWKHDLMRLGGSGRVLELGATDTRARELSSGLGYAFGACEAGGEVWVSESWRHRVVALQDGQRTRTVTDELPAYPSRITPAQGGGYWLTCFAMRTQLIEFVLRESAYRKRMMDEIDPRYWIAPALSSGNTYLEPMQGAQVKTMGVVKPWAPPHSYGLIVRLSKEGLVRYSLHSRFDGKHHGVVSAVECQGQLYVLAKGCRRILRLSVAEAERSLLP